MKLQILYPHAWERAEHIYGYWLDLRRKLFTNKDGNIKNVPEAY
jgi:hypothetical protein